VNLQSLLIVAVAILSVAVVGLVLAVLFTVATARELRRAIKELADATLPVLEEARQMVGRAEAELSQLDDLVKTGRKVVSASRTAAAVMAGPVAKMIGTGAGIRAGTSRLRRNGRR
jgi:hypothetical protein